MSDAENEKLYWWGKIHIFRYYDNDKQETVVTKKKIWIGPMSKLEMLDDFCEFRHSQSNEAPNIEDNFIGGETSNV